MEDKALTQVRRISRPIMVLLSIALGMLVLVQAAYVATILFLFHGGGGWQVAVSASDAGIGLSVFTSPDRSPDVALASLSFEQRSEIALLAVLCTACSGMALFNLRQLFQLFAKGEVFAADSIRHIKRFAIWLVVAAFATNGAGRVFLVVTGQHPHSLANAALALFYGAVVWVIAHVMDLGRQADIERKEFI